MARPPETAPPGIFTLDEVCAIARLGRSKVSEAIASGNLRAVKLGRRCWRITEGAVREWLEIPVTEPLPNVTGEQVTTRKIVRKEYGHADGIAQKPSPDAIEWPDE